MKKNKTIGVLGGMGPEASSNLYQKMISYTQKQYSAIQDYDYPPIIIYSLPLVGFDETGIVDGDLVKKQLVAGVKRLEEAGCDLIIIGCNTVHCYYSDMQSAVSIPIFNIMEETRKKVLKEKYSKVGLLASESTVEMGLYPSIFSKSDISVISPNKEQQQIINQVIEHVMGGSQGLKDIKTLKTIISNYIEQGAEAIVLGCTEIPLAISQKETPIILFDTIQIIVQSAVDFSLNKEKEIKV